MTSDLTREQKEALLRWRLVLGAGAEETDPQRFSLKFLADAAESAGTNEAQLEDLDEALSFVYDGIRGGGLEASRPYLPKWLGLIREFFRQETVAFVQKDAIERRDLKELLFEPETLPFLEKNVDLVTTLLSAQGLVPDEAKGIARDIVRDVVEALRKKLETRVESAVVGALARNTESPLRLARNIDWQRTIRKNLKGWDDGRRRLIAERFYFMANQRRHHEWDIIILVDQSGSMAESVVYASVMAAIFASLKVLRTRLVVFDTEVVDLTPVLADPVEVLFTAQLGGGTDINRAVAFAEEHFVERPEKTILLVVTDLFEGGDEEELLARFHRLKESKVKTLVLLALTDSGRTVHNPTLAQQVVSLGIPCFGCTPTLLADVMERILKGQDVQSLLGHSGSTVTTSAQRR